MPNVQSLALLHEDGKVEVGCNLLAPEEVTPPMVLEHIKRVAAEFGVAVKDSYVIGFTPSQLLEKAKEILHI